MLDISAFRLEILELRSHQDMNKSHLPQPLLAAPDSNMVGEGDQSTELQLMNLRVW